jgi:heme exporter protein B
MKSLQAILKRDLLLAIRQGAGLGPAIGFILAVLVMVPLSIGPDQNLLQRIAPGIMWLALLLAVLLTADRIFQEDLEDGTLEIMTQGGHPIEVIALVKALSHWLTISLPLAVITPLLGFLLNMDIARFAMMLLSTILGSLALSMLASIGGAVTAGLKRGGLLITLLILPLYIPVMIFGISATSGSLQPSGGASALLILAAVTLISAVISPWASAAALRVYLR